jgi:hypothetical protein
MLAMADYGGLTQEVKYLTGFMDVFFLPQMGRETKKAGLQIPKWHRARVAADSVQLHH